MSKVPKLPGTPRQLKKWQLVLIGLTKPPHRVLNILFPSNLPYSRLARSLIGLSLMAVGRATVRLLLARGYIVPGQRGYELSRLGKGYSRDLVSWYVDRSPSRWDRRWRMVIFDVPEQRRVTRDHLRRLLVSYGFKKLQASVWTSPYAVPKEFNQKLWDLGIKNHVLYLLVSEIDYDKTLRRYFPELP